MPALVPNILGRLQYEVEAVCPITGLSFTTIEFDPSATSPQISAANAVLAAFDQGDTDAQAAWELLMANKANPLNKSSTLHGRMIQGV